MASILLTGNRGFIGSRINLKADGLDLKDGKNILTYRAKKKYQTVIHTAALTSVVESVKKPEAYFRTNVMGTLNMVKQHPEAHFLYLSTAGIYGEGIDHDVESEPCPKSPYTLTKYLGEWVVRTFAKSWTIARLTNVIGDGPRGEPNVYQIFSTAKVLPIFGDGLQTRDFIHVDEVCKAISVLISRPGLYNVGSGESKTILDVAREFNKPIKFYPERKGEIRNSGIVDAFDYSSVA